MAESAISVRGLSKRYRFGRAGLLRSAANASDATNFWALRDLNFDVARGEIVGVIGRNGAGKSTLLKILSRVTEPTAGRASIRGRTGSLLEIGTGFHPELTGRENVFLNGAILGMRRREIERKFDEIVDFAEVEKFIDTPVKRYSSGMYVRLAFSVAAHMEPDLMLVDEVLAVGDARFFQKSTDKMRALNRRGMTILLVSHSMWLIQTVCRRAILIDRGRMVAEGSPMNVIGSYRGLADPARADPASDSSIDEVVDLRIAARPELESEQILSDSGLDVTIAARLGAVGEPRHFYVRITGAADQISYFTVYSDPISGAPGRAAECEAKIPKLMLVPGDYVVWAGLCTLDSRETVTAEASVPIRIVGDGAVEPSRSIFWNQARWWIRV